MKGYNGSFFSSSWWMGSFLAGACLGVGIALLFAPQIGPQLRRSLRRYAYNAKDQMSEAWDTALERGQEYIENSQEALAMAGKMMDKALNRR